MSLNAAGPLQALVQQLARLPGLGPRSARRAALYLLAENRPALQSLILSLSHADQSIACCGVCGNLDDVDPCRVCRHTERNAAQICVVAQVADVWAIERSKTYSGHYHVLGGVLSALNGVGVDDLRIGPLIDRLRALPGTPEIILALSPTVDGQSTAHVLTDTIRKAVGAQPVITRLAHGVPMGGELDYLDQGTIAAALAARARVA